MESKDILSDDVVSKALGVSLSTLERFAEAGYLEIDVRTDGHRYFRVNELESLFGIPVKTLVSVNNTVNTTTNSNPILREEVSVESSPSAENLAQDCNVTRDEIAVVVEPADRLDDTPLSQPIVDLELRKLQSIVDLQEKLLDLKEKEIVDLKEQRIWLKDRIERLEENRSRDQLLLLAETQTIRKLVATRSSGFDRVLEWFGLRRQGDTGTGAIEIGNQK